MPKDPLSLVYTDDFEEGWRSDIPAEKLPPGSLVRAENVRLLQGGGFHSRLGSEEMTNWSPSESLPIYNMEKCVEHDIMFVQCGTKIYHTSGESAGLKDIGVILTDNFVGDFKEYNSEMKFSNGEDPYLSITIGKVKTAFTQADSTIIMDPGNTDLFQGNASKEITTVDIVNDKIGFVAHGYSDTNQITFYSADTLPGGLTQGTTYYVLNKTADDFEVSATSGGAAISLTSEGTGVRYVAKALSTVFTAATTDIITATAHGLSNGDRIFVKTTTTLPGGLSVATVYYVINKTTNTFKVSLTYGGAAVDITTTGTGTHTYTKGNAYVDGKLIYYTGKAGDAFMGCTIETGTFAAGAIVTQVEYPTGAPKGSVIESVFEKMMVSNVKPASHAIYYSKTANIDTPSVIDDFTNAGADKELFGKFGQVSAMRTLLTKMYVAKQKGIEAWVGMTDPVSYYDQDDSIMVFPTPEPIREPFTDAYGIVNQKCFIEVGDKLAFLTDTGRFKTIEPDATGVNPEPVINPFFDKKISGTTKDMDTSQTEACMGYNVSDELLRGTYEKDDVRRTVIYHADVRGFTEDTGITPSCWIEWNGSMYYGDALTNKIYKAESGYPDGNINPKMDVLSPNHQLGDKRTSIPVGHVVLSGFITKKTRTKVTVYADGKKVRQVTLSGEGDYVQKTVVRPFGRESVGIDPFGKSGGSENLNGSPYKVAIDVNTSCKSIQIRWEMQGTGYRYQCDHYEVRMNKASVSDATHLIIL